MDKFSDKDSIDAVEFGAGQWDRVINADGTRTYTANTDGATATVKFRPPRVDQEHTGCKTGSTFVRQKDGSWTITHKT